MGFDCEPDEMGIGGSTNFIYPDADIDATYDRMKIIDTNGSAMLLSCYDKMHPDFSPKGSCQAALVNLKYTEPWLRVESHRYFEEKFKWADVMLKDAEKVFPTLRDHIEEIEVSTPLTHLRYLGHAHGAIYGFDQFMKDQPPFASRRGPRFRGSSRPGRRWPGAGSSRPSKTGRRSPG